MGGNAFEQLILSNITCCSTPRRRSADWISNITRIPRPSANHPGHRVQPAAPRRPLAELHSPRVHGSRSAADPWWSTSAAAPCRSRRWVVRPSAGGPPRCGSGRAGDRPAGGLNSPCPGQRGGSPSAVSKDSGTASGAGARVQRAAAVPVEEVPAAWATLRARLAPGGLIVDGTLRRTRPAAAGCCSARTDR